MALNRLQSRVNVKMVMKENLHTKRAIYGLTELLKS
jgi:hypothetical protein